MVCGFDTHHDKRQSKAVGAFVSSINSTFTRYASSVKIHEGNEEISAHMNGHMVTALRKYFESNGNTLPSKVFVYRDGIGAGDIQTILTVEVQACKVMSQSM